ncbi:MAG TPA: M23 family metallopeptidase [Candidatus Faecousia intestinavium]|nr:M23 family metallopeptidase [Candidatus Faecousia intestinavium]
MSDNKRNGRGLSGKGYYIALMLCAAAIGTTSYLYYQNARQAEQAAVQETVSVEIPAGTMGSDDIAVVATQPQSTTAATQATQPAATEKKPLQTVSPVSGDVISGYSMEALSYNQTTRDWRVHNGVDLAAEAGAPVCAAADGEVYTVYEDDSLGYSVVIRHNDGYTTCYANLTEDTAVMPGDTVTMGQTIGYVGSSAIVETTLGSHVHFSVTQNNEPMDPAEFLALGSG